MASYIRNLRNCLKSEVRSKEKLGGVLDYTLQQAAYHAMLRQYPEKPSDRTLSYAHVCQMYSHRELWTEGEERLSIGDITNVQAHFNALKSIIWQIDEKLTQYMYQDVYAQLHGGIRPDMRNELWDYLMWCKSDPYECSPDPLWDVAQAHHDIFTMGGDNSTVELMSFLQCLNLHIPPFFIHAENDIRYWQSLFDVEKLMELFQQEQDRYREETMPLVMEDGEEDDEENDESWFTA